MGGSFKLLNSKICEPRHNLDQRYVQKIRSRLHSALWMVVLICLAGLLAYASLDKLAFKRVLANVKALIAVSYRLKPALLKEAR